jgi:hypothetical protein
MLPSDLNLDRSLSTTADSFVKEERVGSVTTYVTEQVTTTVIEITRQTASTTQDIKNAIFDYPIRNGHY